jgi:hypothetical protein
LFISACKRCPSLFRRRPPQVGRRGSVRNLCRLRDQWLGDSSASSTLAIRAIPRGARELLGALGQEKRLPAHHPVMTTKFTQGAGFDSPRPKRWVTTAVRPAAKARNAVESALPRHPSRSSALTTVPYHTHRGCAAVEHEGVAAVCSPSVETAFESRRWRERDPRADRAVAYGCRRRASHRHASRACGGSTAARRRGKPLCRARFGTTADSNAAKRS